MDERQSIRKEKSHSKVELLAPAGNPAGFYGALHGGADAVYLAGNRFGARAYAENFTEQELIKCIRYGHLLGRKVYMAVNTLLKQQELDELDDYLLPFYQEGLDAVIVQDLGVLGRIRESFPGLKIHASTQMTLCSSYGISLLRDMGADRVVPARELSLEEIIAIKQSLPSVELECFIHGAMCYCYSGQCLFSSVLGGRSGNRGRCAQPCRLPYTVDTGDGDRISGHVLSLKDMCTIRHIPRLIQAGIDSFKIEGRMKKPEYAAGVSEIYRRYIDKYYELREKKGAAEAAEAYSVDIGDEKILNSLYIRSGIQDGYYFRHNGREMITLESPAYNGSDEALLKEIQEKYVKQILKLPITVRADFQEGKPAELVLECSLENVGTLSCSAVGEMVGKAQKQPISRENVAGRLARLGDSAFYADRIEISLGENCFYPMGQLNELRREAAAGLEREVLRARGYEDVFSEKQDRKRECRKEKPFCQNRRTGFAVSVRTLSQLKAVEEWIGKNGGSGILRIYVDADLLVQEWEKTMVLCRTISDHSGCEFYAALPYILREKDKAYLERVSSRAEESGMFRGLLARSMDGIGFVRACGIETGNIEEKINGKLTCRADAGVYVWNSSAAEELEGLTEGCCMPYELRAAEQRELRGEFPREKIVYSRIPMMITANCLRRTSGKCTRDGKKKKQIWSETEKAKEGEKKSRVLPETAKAKDGGKRDRMMSAVKNASEQTAKAMEDKREFHTILKDRYRKEFPVVVNCLHCMNILYNSVPFSLDRELSKWKERADLRIDFTIESPGETGRILDSFIKGKPLPKGEYTAGYEKRGVE